MHKFEPVTPEDLDEIRQLQPEGWGDIVQPYTLYSGVGSGFCRPIKILNQDKIVGIGASIHFGESCWLAHIIVGPGSRNQGIGTKIVSELMSGGLRTSETYSLIATPLGKPIYVKAGFRVVGEYVVLQKQEPPESQTGRPAGDAAGQTPENIVGFKEEHREEVYRLDRRITGEDRSALLVKMLAGADVYLQDGCVRGYWAPKWYEGPVYAETDQAGIALLKKKSAATHKTVLPEENRVGIDFLQRNGFVLTGETRSRMCWGKSLNWKPEKIFSRVAGNIG